MLHPLSGTLHCGLLVPAPQNILISPPVAKHLLEVNPLGNKYPSVPNSAHTTQAVAGLLQAWENSGEHEG